MSPAFLPFLPLTRVALRPASVGDPVRSVRATASVSRHRPGRFVLLLPIVLALFHEPAEAGQFGRLGPALRGAGRVAASLRRSAAAPPGVPTAARPCEPVTTGTPLPPPGLRPAGFPEALWPADCPASNLERYDFSRGQVLADAYHAASAVRCDGCVGAVTAHDDMVYGGLTDRQFGYAMGEWPMDRDVVRRGRRYVNTIHPVGEFLLSGERCKLFRWTLSDGGQALAEKYSLLCLFAGSYQRDKHWNTLVL